MNDNMILAIGSDEMLVKTRAMVLNKASYKVTYGMERDLQRLLRIHSYDLLLVCSSMEFIRASELIADTKRDYPEMRIVRLVKAHSPYILKSIADEVVVGNFNPHTWLSAVARALRSSIQQ